jgi:hypothetical protein
MKSFRITILKILLNISLIIIFLLLILDIAYFFNGSLEMFPTNERQDKIHTVTTVIGAALLTMGLSLFLIGRKYLYRKK